jgi:outer membrane receptor protein involved in Fe transport
MFRRSKVGLAAAMIVSGVGLAPGAAFAQSSDRVEITGSRIKTIQDEGTSPVTAVTAADIKIDGARNVENLLNNLPQVFADQGSTVANGSTGTAQVNLRGLGSDRSLVLINGRRMPMGSPASGGLAADLNQVPAALIRRVEVLTGGASSVYGSDAVAGVVNFILDDKFQGVELELNHSFFNHRQQNAAGVSDIVSTRGLTNPTQFKVPGDKSADGKSTNFSVLVGSNFADNRGNATLFASYKRDNALLQSERDFSACSLGSNAAGFVCGGSGTNATGRITNLADNQVWTNADNAGTARPFAGTDAYNFGPLNYYQRPSERYNVFATANYEIAPYARPYIEFSMHDDLTVAQIAPGGAFGSVHTVNFDNPLLSASWRAALGLNAAGDTTDIVLQRRNVEGGGRQSEFRNTSFRTVAGVKGDVGKWSYDAFAIAARVIYAQSEKNYFVSDRISRAMDVVNDNGVARCASAVDGTDPACVPYNPWLLGGITKAQLDYLQAPGLRKGFTSLELLGANASADLGDYGIKLPTARSGIGVSFGVERRKEELSLVTDSLTSAGQLSGSGGPTPGLEGAYAVNEIYGEARIPIIEGLPFAHLLAANLSFRSSDYSTGKKSDTYGFGLEFAPVRAAKVRASVQRAVRAPNLAELFTAQGNNLYDNDEDPCAGATPTRSLAECARTGVTAAQYGTIQDSPAQQYNYLQGGNPNLKPETADSLTIGLVLNPINDLNVTLDYFDIKVKDTISTIDPTTTLSKCLDTGDPTFCGLITRDRLGTLWLFDDGRIVATNQNIGSLRTSGYDFGINFQQKLGAVGGLNLSFVGTLLKKLEVEEIKGDGTYDCTGLYGPNKCGTPNPKWRHKLRATWQTPWSFDLAATWRHIDEVMLQNTSDQPKLRGNSNAVDRELGSQDYLDLAVNWRPTKNLEVAVGVNNLLDKDPPITSQLFTGTGNGNTYPGVYDAFGRKIFVTATAKF